MKPPISKQEIREARKLAITGIKDRRDLELWMAVAEWRACQEANHGELEAHKKLMSLIERAGSGDDHDPRIFEKIVNYKKQAEPKIERKWTITTGTGEKHELTAFSTGKKPTAGKKLLVIDCIEQLQTELDRAPTQNEVADMVSDIDANGINAGDLSVMLGDLGWRDLLTHGNSVR